jgi:hypothetical protein
LATDTLIGKATTDTLTNKSIAATQLTGTIAAAALPAGSVLQVVNATYATETATTSASFVDTGLTATITPSSTSSKVLVILTPAITQSPIAVISLNLFRGSSLFTWGVRVGWNSGAGVSEVSTIASFSYLDSPSSTSALVYKVQMKRDSGSGTIYAQGNGAYSTITLMEIQG